MIPQYMRDKIVDRLLRAEQDHDVRVLFAIESGSRAWGFASPDSDYDVRFIYAHRREWYEAIDVESRRDVIEYPIVDEIDINGWDVRKALKLFAGSNPAFIEWIQSPITYLNSSCLRSDARFLLPSIYSPTAGYFHYRHMAKANVRNYLSREEVPLKKYLYVMRALLAARHVSQYRLPPPLPIVDLLPLIDSEDVRFELESLIEEKTKRGELGTGPQNKLLNAFIEHELSTEREPTKRDLCPTKMKALNRLFRTAIAGG